MPDHLREQEKERTANRIRILNDLKNEKEEEEENKEREREKEIVKTSSRKKESPLFLLLLLFLYRYTRTSLVLLPWRIFVCLHCGAAGGPSPFISPSSCVVFFFLLTMGETQEEKKTVK